MHRGVRKHLVPGSLGTKRTQSESGLERSVRICQPKRLDCWFYVFHHGLVLETPLSKQVGSAVLK